METCALPNTPPVPVQAAVSVQEVQQIPKTVDLGVGGGGAGSNTEPHPLPALGHRLKKVGGGRHSPPPTPFALAATELSVLSYDFVAPSRPVERTGGVMKEVCLWGAGGTLDWQGLRWRARSPEPWSHLAPLYPSVSV